MDLILKNIRLPLGEISLEVDVEFSGRVAGLFGHSGSGKTTLLEIVAGLRQPTSAFIQFDGCVLTDTAQHHKVPVEQRAIGYVPQDLALFPHFSVQQNLHYGWKSDSSPPHGLTFEHVTDILEIGPLLERGIKGLSGGEKQRVAFARALLASPQLLLLDEPLANLDQGLKEKIIPYLGRIRDEFQVPILYVSHDSREIMALCDEVVVLDRGKIRKKGKPAEIFKALLLD